MPIISSATADGPEIPLPKLEMQRYKLQSTETQPWNKTDAERVIQEASKDPPHAPTKKVDENCQMASRGKDIGSNIQQASGDKGNRGQSSQDAPKKI